MLTTRRLLLAFSLILSSLLVACGTSADGTGDAEGVSLSQSISYEDDSGGTTTISYPDGWVANTEDGTINLATSEDILAETPDTPASGQVIATTLFIPSEMTSAFLTADEEASPMAIATAFSSNFGAEEDNLNDAEEVTIDGKSAAVVTGQVDEAAIVMVIIDSGDGAYAVVIAGTAAGEGDSIRPTIEAMAGSIEYTAGGE